MAQRECEYRKRAVKIKYLEIRIEYQFKISIYKSMTAWACKGGKYIENRFGLTLAIF